MARLLPLAARWLPALAWAAAIFVLSHQPEPLGRQPSEAQSFAAHFFVFGVLAGLLLVAVRGLAPEGRLTYALIVLAASLYGASDEFHQSFVPGRTPDVRDWLMDTLGAAVALLAIALLRWRWRAVVLGGRRFGSGGQQQDVAE